MTSRTNGTDGGLLSDGKIHPNGRNKKILLPVVKQSEAGAFLAALKPNIAHAIVTDPPAGFGYQSREWDGSKRGEEERFIREFIEEVLTPAGYVGPVGPGGLGCPLDRRALVLLRRWLPNPWTLWFRDIADGFRRVLVPGGWCLVWTTPKTRHWAAMGLELAGLEVWDDIAWLYGTGMPKNTNVAWLVDRELGVIRKTMEEGKPVPPVTGAAREAASRGSALCPSREDFILARKPLEGTYARSWLDWRSGTLEIDGLRFSEDARWPKNTIVSPEVEAALGAMSRYFYVQKVRTGSHETEAGLEGLPHQAGHDMVRRKAGTDGLANGRAGRGRSGSGAKNTHPCLAPGSLVLTETGYREIETIVRGDRVYAANGRFEEVEHVSSHPYTSQCAFRVSVQGTNQSVLASDNHPFLAWIPERKGGSVVGGQVQWVNAEHLKKGDYLLTPIPDKNPRGPEVSVEQLWVFGYWLGNGILQMDSGRNKVYPSFTVPNKKPEVVRRLQAYGEYLGVSVGVYPRVSVSQVIIFSRDLGLKFNRWSSTGAADKGFPASMTRMTQKRKQALFDGYVEADGTRTRDYIVTKSVSRHLSSMVQILAWSLGHRARIYPEPPTSSVIKGRRVSGNHDVWVVYIYPEMGKRKTKPETTQHEGRTFRLSYVQSVVAEPYAGDVWNLSVKNDPTFQTIVGMSHNTVKPLELGRLLVRMVARPGQVVVDPFCGSGSLLIAAMQEGCRAVGCDMNPEYVEISKRRAKFWHGQPVPPLDFKKPGGIKPAPRSNGTNGADGPIGGTERSVSGEGTERTSFLGSSMRSVTVRFPANLGPALEKWAYPISWTITAALDHYFGMLGQGQGNGRGESGGGFGSPGGPGGAGSPVIPAGYLEGFEPAAGPGAPVELSLPAALVDFLRREELRSRSVGVKGAAVATIRRALCMWLGIRETPEDRKKAIPRYRMRLEQD